MFRSLSNSSFKVLSSSLRAVALMCQYVCHCCLTIAVCMCARRSAGVCGHDGRCAGVGGPVRQDGPEEVSHLRPLHRPDLLLPVLLRSGIWLLPLLQILLRFWVRRTLATTVTSFMKCQKNPPGMMFDEWHKSLAAA